MFDKQTAFSHKGGGAARPHTHIFGTTVRSLCHSPTMEKLALGWRWGLRILAGCLVWFMVEVEKRVLTKKLGRAWKGGTPEGQCDPPSQEGGLTSLTANESRGHPGPSPRCAQLTEHSDLNSHQSRNSPDSAGLATWLTP